MRVGGVVLAAGRSSRMGRLKLLLPFEGRPLLCASLQTMASSGADPVLCVVGFRSADLLEAVRGCPTARPIRYLVNRKYASGRASSVRLALRALPEDCEAAVFLPGDMPLLRAADVRALVERFASTGAPIVVGVDERGRRSHPVLFARRLFPRLAALGGDESGHALIEALWGAVEKVPVPDRLALDVDCEDDYRRLISVEGAAHA